MTQKTDTTNVCQSCGLWSRTAQACQKQFPSYGSETPTVLVVMNQIEEADMIAGGICGTQLIRDYILTQIATVLKVEDPVPLVRFSSLTRCPFGNTKPTQDHHKHCADILAQEIAAYRPRVVLGIGGPAKFDVYAALGLPSRTRGFVQEVPRAIPLLSPLIGTKKQYAAALDRGDFPCHVLKTSNLNWAFREPFVFREIQHDFQKIPGIIAGTYPVADTFAGRNYTVVATADHAVQVFDYFAALPRFSFDIEAGPWPYALDPYSVNSKILGIGLCGVDRASFFMPLHHKDCPYPDQVPRVLEAMQRCLEGGAEKTAHNAAFDGSYIRVKYGYEVANIHFDTQLAHGLLDENVKHALKYLAEMDTDLGYYDDELLDGFRDVNGKQVTAGRRCYEKHISLDVLGRYCCADADATEQLRLKYEEDLRQHNLLNYCYKMTMPDVNSVIETQVEGIKIDTEHRDGLLIDFQAKLDAAGKPIRNSAVHKVWLVDKSKQYKGRGKYLMIDEGFIYRDYEHFAHYADKPLAWFPPEGGVGREYMQGAFDELRMAKAMLKTKDTLSKSGTYRLRDIALNLHSNPDLQKFLYGKRFCGLHPVKETKGGGAATDKESMNKLKDQDPICGSIIDVRTWQKNLSTYCLPFQCGHYEYVNTKGVKKTGVGYIRDDGLCHPSYVMSGNDRGQGTKEKGKGTRTGRKSAVEPPIQTMKTRGDGGKPIKRLFISKHGPTASDAACIRASAPGAVDPQGVLCQWDFSQLELRLFAMIAGIMWMIRKYQEGADLHLELAMEIWSKTAEECLENNRFYRDNTKEFWFGPIYGESARGISEQLATKGMIISKDEAQAILDRMYLKMPEYDMFKARTVQSLKEHCAVWTVTGRRRYLPTYYSSEKYLISQSVRQAINFLIQSPGSDMTTISWFTLNRWAKRMKLRARIAISVHDSLIWDCPPGELPICSVATKFMMEHVPFRFLADAPIPIIADGEAGTSWGSMVDLTKTKGIDEADINTLGSDLLPYRGTGVAPLAHWESTLMDHSHLDPLKEFCAEHNYI